MAHLNTALAPAFATFLRKAAMALHANRLDAFSIYREAAGYLNGTDDLSIRDLIQALMDKSAIADALSVAQAWAELRPDSAAANYCCGCVLQITGRYTEAIARYRKAMLNDADYPQLRNNLAVVLMLTQGDPGEIRALLEQSVQVDPGNVNAWINLTALLRDAHDVKGALLAGERAVALSPDNAMARSNYAAALQEDQRWDDALSNGRAACEAAPDSPVHLYNQAMLLLLHCEFAEGFAGYESRWQCMGESAGRLPPPTLPQWKGESVKDKTLLVWGEQGVGDLLQFCRLIPQLSERVHPEGGRLVWNVFPETFALLKRSLEAHADEFTASNVVAVDPRFDYHLPLLSLPLILGLTEATIPSSPYLIADPAAVQVWRDRLSCETRLKVGLVWSGNSKHPRNPFRQVGWHRYVQHLSKVDGVAFYALQPGLGGDIEAARHAGLDLIDHTGAFETFDDTAAFVAALDLVVTVCTSVAHLSGALGRPTWILLDVNPHWPWQLVRSDSPWYPSAKLYRQHAFGQWEPVLDRLAADLASLARDVRVSPAEKLARC